jgi:hypothetical protein
MPIKVLIGILVLLTLGNVLPEILEKKSDSH